MSKIQIIEECNHCRHFNNNMYGTRCFHPKVTKPHAEGVVPKTIKSRGLIVCIPKWCPLDDATT